MSIDILQNKIKKLKSPIMADLSLLPSELPPVILRSDASLEDKYQNYYSQMFSTLKNRVPAIRFRLSVFSLIGTEGLTILFQAVKAAKNSGFYVLLEIPDIMPEYASCTAQLFLEPDTQCPCSGLAVSAYSGSDILKALLPYCNPNKNDLFAIIRTPNKSASELQDLLAGSRMVHLVGADNANRFSGETLGKSGFSRVAVSASATAGESLRVVRSKYPNLFILVDGLDYSGANAKNCSYAFDKMGHGAIVCIGKSASCAWEKDTDGGDFAQKALDSAEKTIKKIERYITIL